MPISLPSRAEILEQVKADMRAELGVDPMRRSPEYALARALAGQSKGQYSMLAQNYRDAFPDTASEGAFWLWARTWITQKPAAPWRGIYRITGTDTTVITAGRSITRSDGAAYTVDAEQVIGEDVTGYVDVAITAVVAGVAGNNDDGQPMALTSPLVGADSAGTVQSSTVDGSEVENAEDGLARLLSYLQDPVRGGGPGDYKRWAREVPGVTRAWEFAHLYGPNTVGVAFVRDNDGSGADVIPSSGERAEVLAYVQGKAPITVTVYVIELTALVVDYEILDLVPDSTTVRAAIALQLADFHLREAAPDSTLTLSRLDAAVSAASGELSHTLNAPSAPVTATKSQIQVVGTISYAASGGA